MNRRTLIATTLVIALAGGIAFAMWQSDINDQSSQVETSSEDFTDGDDRETFQSVESGTRIEDDGASEEEASEETDPDSGISSDSGTITVFSPQPNSTFGNGSKIEGLAEASQIQYRVIDFGRGVLTQGQLSVNNGSFSGTVSNINPSSNSGRIDIFSFNTETGVEENIIEIEVRF